MEYGDFLYIGLNGLSFIKEPVDFLDYITWLSVDNFKPLEEQLISYFSYVNQKERLPVRSTADDIIAGMVVTSEADFNRKTSSDNYYICNAHAVLAVIRHIFKPEIIDTLNLYNQRSETRFLVENYQDILLWILRDVEDLASLYAENRWQKSQGQQECQRLQEHQKQRRQSQMSQGQQQEHQSRQNQQKQQCEHLYRNSVHSSDGFNSSSNSKSSIHSFIRNRYVPTASLYQVFRQGLFGSISEHSFTDKEPSANIATIRQLIELRLRRGFGVLAFSDTYKDVTAFLFCPFCAPNRWKNQRLQISYLRLNMIFTFLVTAFLFCLFRAPNRRKNQHL